MSESSAHDLNHRADVVIVGGGLTGSVLALALGRIGLRVTVLERAPMAEILHGGFDGRVTAIARSSKYFLERLGVWHGLQPHAQPILDIKVNEGYGFAKIHYDHRDVGDEPLGWIVENRHIRLELLRAIDLCACINVVSPADITSIAQDDRSAVVRLGDGRQHQCALLTLADGRHSRLRGQAGIQAATHHYDQTGLVATFAHQHPHQGLAVERFFPDGPFAMLPMNGDRSSMVWALKSERARAIARLDDQAFTDEVQERFGDPLGALKLQGPRWCYPLALVIASAYQKGRVALIGDCARGIHPIAGQGWNLALRDVAVLAELITERAQAGLDIGEPQMLERYASRRRGDAATLVAATDGINRLFANDAAPLRLAREIGLAMVETMRPLKRLFMLHAMGMLGDHPKLMRPVKMPPPDTHA